MCVIINKDPGITIPFDKIRSACIVNPDGWGLTVVDRGRMETIRHYDEKGNDPDKLQKFLEQCKDHRTFIHLRYSTAGKKDEDNCHPFETLSFKDYGFGVGFMHNGTVSTFRENNSDRSDSWHLNETLLKPTVEAFYSLHGDKVLKDPTLNRIVKEFCNNISCFMLYDSNGEWMIIDKKGEGKEYKEEGFWSSNSYSFDRTHRDPKTYGKTNYYGHNSGDHWSDYDYQDGVYRPKTTTGGSARGAAEGPKKPDLKALPAPANSDNKKEEVTPPFRTEDSDEDERIVQCKLVGTALSEAKRKGLTMAHHTPPGKRVTFAELADLNSLEEICIFNEEEIEDLCCEQPIAAATLIMDLRYALFVHMKELRKAAH